MRLHGRIGRLLMCVCYFISAVASNLHFTHFAAISIVPAREACPTKMHLHGRFGRLCSCVCVLFKALSRTATTTNPTTVYEPYKTTQRCVPYSVSRSLAPSLASRGAWSPLSRSTAVCTAVLYEQTKTHTAVVCAVWFPAVAH